MSDVEITKTPTVTVSMSRKLNLGNYESADFFVCITGAHAGMTSEEIAALLTVGKDAWEQVRRSLGEQIRNHKANGP